jgi:transposase-like protein
MKAIEFRDWLEQVFLLTRRQRVELDHCLHAEATVAEVVAEVEQARPEECPHCQSPHLYRWGRRAGWQRYRCRACGLMFTAVSGTPLARLHHKERWLSYGQALIDGVSVRVAAAQCGIDKTTSFRWRHRFLRAPAQQQPQTMQGIVEADETFFRQSFKGQRQLPRSAHHRGQPTRQRGTGSEQVPVLVVRDRHGATANFQLLGTSAADIEPALKKMCFTDAVLCTDGAAAYRIVARHLAIAHRPINLSAGVRVLGGVYHIQNVNAYDSRLKQWMTRFHGVATKYLENYLGWRRWLELSASPSQPKETLFAALGRQEQFQPLSHT